MSAVLLALFLVSADEPPLAKLLPMESIIFYRDGSAWVRRRGAVDVKDGRAVVGIDGSVDGNAWNLTAIGASPKPQRIEDRVAHNFGSDPKPIPVVVHFDPKATKAELAFGGRIDRIGWSPRYELICGPETKCSVELTAVVTNHYDHVGNYSGDIAAPLAEFAIGLPFDRNLQSQMIGLAGLSIAHTKRGPNEEMGPAAQDPGSFAVENFRIAAHSDLRQTLLRFETEAIAEFEWLVAGPPKQRLKTPESDRVQALLLVPNHSGRSLPPGSVLVREGDRPSSAAIFPYVEANQTAPIVLGTAFGVDVKREETELQRKRGVVQRENEEYDWVEMAGSLTLENRRPAPATIRIVKAFEGEGIAASDDAKIRRRPNELGSDNPVTEIVWKLTLAPNQTRRLTYGYRLHLPPL